MPKRAAVLFLLVFPLLNAGSAPVSAAPVLKPVDFRDLSDRNISAEGREALQMDRELWKHAETEHFVYHFRDQKKAETVYVHAEAYYQWVKEMFGVSEDTWPSKGHIYIFGDKVQWKEFNKKPGERLPGAEAYTNGADLFLYRDPFYLEPQKTLAHEIAHIVAIRFVKGKPPLYLHEGIAEFISYKALAMQTDGDEYRFHTIAMIPDADFIQLEELSGYLDYPASEAAKRAFYHESELFVRYLLLNHGADKFRDFFGRSAAGDPLEDALKAVYGLELEETARKFRIYTQVKGKK